MKHAERHPRLDVPGCFGCKIAHVSISADAMPSRSPDAVWRNGLERSWEKDLPAYKRLRDDGLQPDRVDGARLLEQGAKGEHEVEGRPDPKMVERFADVMSS